MRRAHIKREDGQTMVEFVLVAPVLLLILFGIIQFGIAFKDSLALTDAVRAGARKVAVSRSLNNCDQGAAQQAVRDSAIDLTSSNVQPTITFSAGCTPGSSVTVSATYPYSIDILGFVVTSGNLHSQTIERVE
jgi:Flp pilus assembly protein TadG